MIDKYSSNESPDFWYAKQTAQDLVALFIEHRALVQDELDEVRTPQGRRKLSTEDFLGPRERAKRKKSRQMQELDRIFREMGQEARNRALDHMESENNKDYSKFFHDLDNKMLQQRRDRHKKAVFEEAYMRESRLQK